MEKIDAQMRWVVLVEVWHWTLANQETKVIALEMVDTEGQLVAWVPSHRKVLEEGVEGGEN